MTEDREDRYSADRRAFDLSAPADYNWAFDTFDPWAADPSKLAMVWVGAAGERRLTFEDVRRRSNRAANALERAGVGPGDRVFLMLGRVPEWWELMLACIRLGAVAMPATTQLTPKDVAYRMELAGARVAVADAENAAKVDAARDACPSVEIRVLVGGRRDGWLSYDDATAAAGDERARRPTPSDDPCLVYFTSGTVGYPKMVLHTHASYPLGHTITGRYWLDLRPEDLHWNVADTGWAKAAWSSLFGPWTMGAAILVVDSRGKFSAAETLELLSRHPVTTFCAPPTVYRSLVLEELSAYDLSHVRHCTGAGEPLNPEVIATWREATGLTIRDGYGQTETVVLCGNFPSLEVRPGSMGKPSPGFDLAVIDDAGEPLPAGREGDIAVRIAPERPLAMFKEYWRDEEATRASVRGDWYVTGDRAVVDEDGYFWFVGRADDVILSAGYRIGPFEVESALVEHPAVAEAAVCASPDPIRGEIVKAFVVLVPGYVGSEALAAEIQEHVKTSTAPYKYPREVEFVDELPKTVSGKIRRVELREREARRKRGE